MNFKKLPFLIIPVLLSITGTAQQIISRLSILSTCPGQVTVSHDVENFQGIASVSLKYFYDTTSLYYLGSHDTSPGLSGGLFLMNASVDQVIISWFSLNPVSLGNTCLVKADFDFKGDKDVLLNWDDSTGGNCVYTDITGEPLDALFVNGQVKTLMKAPLLLTPANFSSNISIDTLLHWNGVSCGPLYDLEVSRDSLFTDLFASFSGIFGTSKTLTGMEYSTKYFWRVRAVNSLLTTAWSSVYSFTTEAEISTPEYSKNGDPLILCYPNPAVNATSVRFGLSGPCEAKINLINSFGDCMRTYKFHIGGNNLSEIDLDLNELSPGFYVIGIDIISGGNKISASRPLVILEK